LAVIFDVVGTLFSLERVEKEFQMRVLPPELFGLWFARLQMTSMAASLAGGYFPFRETAEAALRQLLAARELPESEAAPVLAAMGQLAPWPDAGRCLSALRESGHRIFALTNSSSKEGTDLIVQSGLAEYFEAVLSADEVKTCKPHPAPYRMAVRRIGLPAAEISMVAAHGWDVLGAAAAGLQTIWVSRLECRWPFPGRPPGSAALDLAGVPDLLTAQPATVEGR